MTRSAIAALALGLSLLAACGEEESKKPKACQDHCGRQAAASCAEPIDVEECVFACTYLWNGDMCQAEWRASITCTANATWSCDEASGYPVTGVECRSVMLAFLECADASP